MKCSGAEVCKLSFTCHRLQHLCAGLLFQPRMQESGMALSQLKDGKPQCVCGLETGPSSTLVLLEVLVWRGKNVLSVQRSDWAQPA